MAEGDSTLPVNERSDSAANLEVDARVIDPGCSSHRRPPLALVDAERETYCESRAPSSEVPLHCPKRSVSLNSVVSPSSSPGSNTMPSRSPTRSANVVADNIFERMWSISVQPTGGDPCVGSGSSSPDVGETIKSEHRGGCENAQRDVDAREHSPSVGSEPPVVSTQNARLQDLQREETSPEELSDRGDSLFARVVQEETSSSEHKNGSTISDVASSWSDPCGVESARPHELGVPKDDRARKESLNPAVGSVDGLDYSFEVDTSFSGIDTELLENSRTVQSTAGEHRITGVPDTGRVEEVPSEVQPNPTVVEPQKSQEVALVQQSVSQEESRQETSSHTPLAGKLNQATDAPWVKKRQIRTNARTSGKRKQDRMGPSLAAAAQTCVRPAWSADLKCPPRMSRGRTLITRVLDSAVLPCSGSSFWLAGPAPQPPLLPTPLLQGPALLPTPQFSQASIRNTRPRAQGPGLLPTPRFAIGKVLQCPALKNQVPRSRNRDLSLQPDRRKKSSENLPYRSSGKRPASSIPSRKRQSPMCESTNRCRIRSPAERKKPRMENFADVSVSTPSELDNKTRMENKVVSTPGSESGTTPVEAKRLMTSSQFWTFNNDACHLYRKFMMQLDAWENLRWRILHSTLPFQFVLFSFLFFSTGKIRRLFDL